MEIEDYRKRLNEIDDSIVDLLSERIRLSSLVGKYKREKGLEIFDSLREKEILKRLCVRGCEKDVGENFIKEVFNLILYNSKEIQKMSENVSFEEWSKLDLRVGEILEVEDIEGADKLYKLKIDLGTETRILVAGLKNFYTKNELEGKKCIVFVNLEPRVIRGIESKGMILAVVSDDKSEVKLLNPDGVVELGSRVS